MKILRMLSTDPYFNLATEEFILCNRTDDDYLLLWQNDNTIVIGLHQNTSEEINTDFVKDHAINVVRRRTGGGAVYHDLGNLNFSFITDAHEASKMTMKRFTLPIVAALNELGLTAEASGRNDIMANGHKVSGNAQTLFKKRILHHGTLLFDSDLSVLSQALKVKPEKFLSKSIKSVRGRVGNIKELLPTVMSINDFGNHLAASLTKEVGAEYFELTPDELTAIKKLRDEKYSAWDWVYGKSPNFNFRNQEKYAGGFLEVMLNIHDGKIAACIFYGDFMALRPATEVAKLLIGCRYDATEIKNILAPIPLNEYFGTISQQEIISCMVNHNKQ